MGLIASAIVYLAKPAPRTRAQLVEALLSYFVLFAIGITYFYNFVMHVFFGEMSARFIGWADTPFQTELGFASLGFAAVGFLAFRGDRSMRVAAIVGVSFFLLGAAGVHIYEMITAHNFAPGNAGIIFWTDILVPAIGFGPPVSAGPYSKQKRGHHGRLNEICVAIRQPRADTTAF